MDDFIVWNRKDCRLCGSLELALALPLNPSPIGDAYVTEEEISIAQPSYPLSLHLCKQCGHLQLCSVINPSILFGNYIYRTSTSHGLVEHFRQYADAVYQRIQKKGDSLAVEIGSNDGTLLNFFKQHGMKTLGIDPAEVIAAEATAKGIDTWPTFFTHELAKMIKNQHGTADLMLANNVFAHVDKMDDLMSGIEHLLSPEGIFVFEASYLVDMFQKNVFDTIYHEHVCYHRIKPLEIFFNRYGMTFFDVTRIQTKGGSIRGFVKFIKSKRKVEPIVQELIQLENTLQLDHLAVYEKFSARLNNIKQAILQILKTLKSEGKTIIGYGASPAVTTTTHQFELNPYLDFIVDDNPIKQGRYTPGSHKPVFSSEVIYEKKPDYILILAWQYADIIMKRHAQFSENGGRFIIPLPDVQVK